MRYIPHTPEDIQRMLAVIGAKSVDDLFSSIPEARRFREKLDLPAPLSEAELLEHLRALGASNQPQSHTSGDLCFAGAGLYRHYIPSAVDALAGRSEFYTAYTPYQPELSQGTLLGIFEFQTMVAELLGMSVANASMYDGASATAEAVLMARRLTGRTRALLASGLHPEYAQTCRTYLSGMEGGVGSLSRLPFDTSTGTLDLAALRAELDESVAAVVVQTPSFFGVLEDLEPIAQAVHAVGAQLIAVCNEPLALALLKPPGAAGADIAVGEGCGLCGPINLGGPGVGFFAVKDKKAVRSMPGRLVGETVDSAGRRGYVLTLSTREQHIRREKATSNICTNHGLMALRFTIHLSLLGKTGFAALARLNLSRAAFARKAICAVDGFAPRFTGPMFNELAVRVPGGDADAIVRAATARHVVPGVALGRFFPELKDTLLVAVTETHTREDILRLAKSWTSIGGAA
jgi:glycine dehydrogenase subunit 1